MPGFEILSHENMLRVRRHSFSIIHASYSMAQLKVMLLQTLQILKVVKYLLVQILPVYQMPTVSISKTQRLLQRIRLQNHLPSHLH